MRDVARLLIQNGASAATTTSPKSRRLVLVAQGATWARAELTIELANRVLARPLKVLLENRQNDWDFLIHMVPAAHRHLLERAKADGRLEPEQGGGLTELKKRLEALASPTSEQDWIERLRIWVMFDRDAHPEDRARPSELSGEVLDLVSKMKAPWTPGHHQLSRRAIENYIPNATLNGWWLSQGPVSERRGRAQALAELRKLRVSAAHQFNMKRGLLGDVARQVRLEVDEQSRDLRDDELDALFRGLPDPMRSQLQTGFPGVAGAFSDKSGVDPAAFAKFADDIERDAIGQSILEAL